MIVTCNKEPILNTFEEFFSYFGYIFDAFFKKSNQKMNAVLVIQTLKEKKIDIEELKSFLESLPMDRWEPSFFAEKVSELNQIFGMSDDEIKNHCVTEVNEKQLDELKWEINVQSMLESSKFANEYYDALKYNQNADLSLSKRRFLNELMKVFNYIKLSSKDVYNRFEKSKYNKRTVEKFNVYRFAIDLLWMRILFILFNVNDSDDNKIDQFTEILAKERISLTYQKAIVPKYS